jgi:molybdate transport system substrate-binding protein
MRPRSFQGVAAAVLALAAASACGDEIRVISGGAARAFVEPLAKTLPGHSVLIDWQPMGRLVQSLAAGQAADMVIVTEELARQLESQNRIERGTARPIARVGIGVAVHESARLPDISTPQALRDTLLAAKSVVYIDPKIGTSGKHVAEVLARLGIADEVNRKATLGQGGYVVAPVGRGEIELGIHQVSEILPVKGVKLVGELPRELQKYTVYLAAPMPASAKRAAVEQFITHLHSREARERLASAGYTVPE